MLLVFTFHKETLKVFKMVHLTQQQLKIIRDTWTHVHPIATHGQNIFYNFFKKYPQNLQYFPKFHGIELEKIKVILASKCKFWTLIISLIFFCENLDLASSYHPWIQCNCYVWKDHLCLRHGRWCCRSWENLVRNCNHTQNTKTKQTSIHGHSWSYPRLLRINFKIERWTKGCLWYPLGLRLRTLRKSSILSCYTYILMFFTKILLIFSLKKLSFYTVWIVSKFLKITSLFNYFSDLVVNRCILNKKYFIQKIMLLKFSLKCT